MAKFPCTPFLSPPPCTLFSKWFTRLGDSAHRPLLAPPRPAMEEIFPLHAAVSSPISFATGFFFANSFLADRPWARPYSAGHVRFSASTLVSRLPGTEAASTIELYPYPAAVFPTLVFDAITSVFFPHFIGPAFPSCPFACEPISSPRTPRKGNLLSFNYPPGFDPLPASVV